MTNDLLYCFFLFGIQRPGVGCAEQIHQIPIVFHGQDLHSDASRLGGDPHCLLQWEEADQQQGGAVGFLSVLPGAYAAAVVVEYNMKYWW